jgi:hypothetical protein
MAQTVVSDMVEQQKAAAAFVQSTLTSGAEPVLKAQAELLTTVQSTFASWLRRRHEAVVDTQHLVARLHTNRDPGEFVSVQHEWVAGAVKRLAADAAAYQEATQHLVDLARGWFPHVAETAAEIASATRAAGKPLRQVGKAE